jgi:predicted transcriptional regulator
MDTANAGTAETVRSETEAERLDRLAWEAAGLAEARAELNAGLYVDADEMRAWINSLRTEAPLPPPPTRRL